MRRDDEEPEDEERDWEAELGLTDDEPASGYIRPSRGGARTNKIKVAPADALDDLGPIRREMISLYRRAVKTVGDELDPLSAARLASILKSAADLKTNEHGEALDALQQKAKARLDDKPKRRVGRH